MLEMICEELGVKVDEEWLGSDGKTYMIENGRILEYYEPENYSGTDYEGWVVSEYKVYADILQGKLKPVWKPKYKERYYIPRMNYEMYDDWCWVNDKNDNWWFENGMIFKTKEEAIECTNRMIKTVREYQHEIS